MIRLLALNLAMVVASVSRRHEVHREMIWSSAKPIPYQLFLCGLSSVLKEFLMLESVMVASEERIRAAVARCRAHARTPDKRFGVRTRIEFEPWASIDCEQYYSKDIVDIE